VISIDDENDIDIDDNDDDIVIQESKSTKRLPVIKKSNQK